MDGSFVGERPIVNLNSSEIVRLEVELSTTKDNAARAAWLRARIAEIRSSEREKK